MSNGGDEIHKFIARCQQTHGFKSARCQLLTYRVTSSQLRVAVWRQVVWSLP